MLTLTNYSNPILNKLSFSLPKNKNFIILGSNGIGKTTLAKVLCGITASDAVNIEGLNPSKVFGEQRTKAINYVPPKLEIFDSFMSVKEFLELSCLQQKPSVEEAMKKLQIEQLSAQPCHSLSSGESQLVLMASAWLHNATYTIFDEPTANLDPQKIQLLFKLLKEEQFLQSKIIITHNLDLAYKLGFDILYLANKEIRFQGSSEVFFAQEN
ncbi:MAG TPA: ATP-binding cassette domain-containing protein, partial [Campylobacterales bacterium]|nr:ATP-binding cassette domain-containing protein [Campylobacterales bacterium]